MRVKGFRQVCHPERLFEHSFWSWPRPFPCGTCSRVHVVQAQPGLYAWSGAEQPRAVQD